MAENENAEAATAAASSAARGRQGGGHGLLWAVGADEHLFQKMKAKATAAGSSSSSSDGKRARLFQVKGKRDVFKKEVECCFESLNEGDVFLLDPFDGEDVDRPVIWQWNGKKSNRIEQSVGLDFAKKIRDKVHGGKPKIVILDCVRQETPIPNRFWETW